VPNALVLQPTSEQRLPPPWAMHLSVAPWALALQPTSEQRLPPPWATHLPVAPRALVLQPNSERMFVVPFLHVFSTFFTCDSRWQLCPNFLFYFFLKFKARLLRLFFFLYRRQLQRATCQMTFT
jgi:hypothetical protein